jgi:cytoskeleton protein RodZ
VPSFGAKLKQEREQRGITLDEISSSTKIGTRMLHALEEDHFDQLPGGIFNKGFIRAYARCLGIDEEQAIADYLVASGTGEPQTQAADGPAAAPIVERMENERVVIVPWGVFAITLLGIALGFAAWGFYSRAAGKLGRSVRNTSIAPQITSGAPGEARSVPSGTVQHAPSPVSTPKVTSVSATVPAKTASVSSAPLLLRINLRQDSWISITADGHESTRGTLTAPAERSVQAKKEIVVKAGNSGAVDFEFNGKKVPAQGVDGQVQTIVFDSTGWRVETTSFTPAATAPQP